MNLKSGVSSVFKNRLPSAWIMGTTARSLERKQTNTNALAQHSGLFHQETSERYGSRLLTCQMCVLLVPDVNLAAVWTPDLTAVEQQI